MEANLNRTNVFTEFLRKTKSFFFGNSVSFLASFLATLVLAKSLNAESFGEFVYIVAIIGFIEGISTSQSWQMFIKFMPKAKESNLNCATELVKTSLIIDLLNIALALLMLVIAIYWHDLIGVKNVEYLLVYGLVLPLRMHGTLLGIVRFDDRLAYVSMQLCAIGVIKLVISCAFFVYEFDLLFLYIGFFFSELFGIVFLLIGALKSSLMSSSFISLMRTKLVNQEQFRSIVKFQSINQFNINSVLAVRTIDEIIIGKFIGMEQLGYYKLVKLFSSILSKIVEPMYTVIYPEFTKLIHGKDRVGLSTLIKNITKLTGVLSFIFFVVGTVAGPVLIGFFNEYELDNRYTVLGTYFLAICINMMFFYAHPFSISLGLEKEVLVVNLLAGAVYLLLLLFFANTFGLLGVVSALLFYNLVSTFARLILSFRQFRKV